MLDLIHDEPIDQGEENALQLHVHAERNIHLFKEHEA